MRKLGLALLASCMITGAALAAEDAEHPKELEWQHKGITGTFDRSALQRGFQVYKQVCSACHSMRQLHYRDLSALGYNEAELKSIAAEYTVQDGPNDEGEMFDRPARPADHFHNPFANENAARAANGGAYPKDLSLMAKARHGGEDYIYSLLTGYTEPPEGVKVPAGLYYNPYFPGRQIAMPPPLVADDQVSYADGTKATKEQMAKDVATFLTWAAEPKLEERKKMGLQTIIYLTALAIVMYFTKKQIWAKMKKKPKQD